MEKGTLKSEFRVAEWLVRPALSEMEKDGKTIQLEPKVMALLEVLSADPGDVFSRQELEKLLWPESVVGYDALSKAVTKLRDAFGDDKKQPQYIQTISKKGYRLIAPVVRQGQHGTRQSKQSHHGLLKHHPGFGKVLATSLVLVLLVVMFWPKHETDPNRFLEESPTQVVEQKPVMVILPFRDVSPEGKHAYLADGITNDLITDMSQLSELWVIDSSAVLPYKDKELNPNKARDEFNARYVVSGDVLRVNDRIRVNIHLNDAEHGKVLWAERFDRKFTDFFAIKDQVTQHIVEKLSLTMSQGQKQRIARRYTHNLEAYDLFLQAQGFATVRTAENSVQAVELYEKAIDLDPQFARAYAGLAMTYTIAYLRQWPLKIKDPMARALELADYAITLDDDLPEVFWVAGFVNANQKNLDRASLLLMNSLALNPNYADAYAMLGWIHVSQGKPELTLEYMSKAMRLNPRGGHLYFVQLGRANFFLKRYTQALSYFEKAHQNNPTYIDTMLYLAITYLNLNRREDARWIYQEAKSQYVGFDPQLWVENLPIVEATYKEKLRNDLMQVESLGK